MTFSLITSPSAPDTIIVTSSSAWSPAIVTVIVLCSSTATVGDTTVNDPAVAYTSNEVSLLLSRYLSLVRYTASTVYVPTAGLSIVNAPSPSFT